MAVRVREGTPREVGGRIGPKHRPGSVYILAPGYSADQCRRFSMQALAHARKITPKLTGEGSKGLQPYFGAGYFGIQWPQDLDYMWIQEAGSRPFTMKSLAGKTIPMWVNDPTGKVARENPKAEKRVTASGKRQVKIFRRAAKIGQRKRVAVRDGAGRLIRWRDVPASYPGAPGRIARRGRGGQITSHAPSGHHGVRWRNPGLHPRQFMEHSIQEVGRRHQFSDLRVFIGYRRQGRPLVTPPSRKTIVTRDR